MKIKKTMLFFIVALFCIIISSINTKASSYSSLDEYLDSCYDAYPSPGFSVLITNKDDLVYEAHYGEVTSNTNNYFIGSESKSFTALAILKLAEENKLSLDDEISKYIDVKLSKPITIKNLLNQTSGFETYQKQNQANVNEKKYGSFEYANQNFDLLGKIIENVTTKAYGEYINDNIFTPLNMNNSYADINKINLDSFQLGYKNYFGSYIKSKPVLPNDTSWFNVPAGYIASNNNDMIKYLRMYLNNDDSIISKDAINSMFNNRVSVNNNHTYYGYGWFYCDYFNNPFIFHQGLTEVYQTYMFILPNLGIAGQILIPSFDEFVNTKSYEDMAFNTMKVLSGISVDSPNKSAYTSQHILIDIIYILLIGYGLFLVIYGIMSITKNTNNKKQFFFLSSGFALALITILFPVIMGASYFAVSHYVTDCFIIIITSFVLYTSSILLIGAQKIRNIISR